MVRHAASRGIRPMLCTNGSLWTEEKYARLRQRWIKQRDYVD